MSSNRLRLTSWMSIPIREFPKITAYADPQAQISLSARTAGGKVDLAGCHDQDARTVLPSEADEFPRLSVSCRNDEAEPSANSFPRSWRRSRNSVRRSRLWPSTMGPRMRPRPSARADPPVSKRTSAWRAPRATEVMARLCERPFAWPKARLWCAWTPTASTPRRYAQLCGSPDRRYDLVIGARKLEYRGSWKRGAANHFFNAFATWLSRTPVEDLTELRLPSDAPDLVALHFLPLCPAGFSRPPQRRWPF